jgi:hypothetical protein
MVEYCPNCSKAELVLKMVEDAAVVARAVRTANPAGAAAALAGMALDTQRDRRGSFTTGPVAAADRVLKTKRRKVSKYQKTFGKNLKALKRKHPRTQARTLMKRAHSMTKRALR